jgi:hypothetical protein
MKLAANRFLGWTELARFYSRPQRFIYRPKTHRLRSEGGHLAGEVPLLILEVIYRPKTHRLRSEGAYLAGEVPLLILEALYTFPAECDHPVTRAMVRDILHVKARTTGEVPDNASQFGASVYHLTEIIRKALAVGPNSWMHMPHWRSMHRHRM